MTKDDFAHTTQKPTQLISLGSETMKGKMFKSIVLIVSIMLVFAGGANASGGNVTPIKPGPPTSLPDYIGAPAKPHPTANSGVPQNPYLVSNPFNTIHVDPWMSDVYDISGPLGRDPIVMTSRLEDARNDPNSKVFSAPEEFLIPMATCLPPATARTKGV